MKSIDIFVAGAKNLDEYRDALKILANELNVENKLKNKNVLVRMCDYKDIGDNQKDYDAFITHNAAGLFAIVVDDFGVETQKELKLAAQRFAKSKRSMVKVFIKKSADKEKMELIYSFIKLILGEGQYGEEFKDVTEFKSRAKKYLKNYIRDAHRTEKSNNKFLKIGVILAAVIIAIGGFLMNNLIPEDNILLVVGGGSAKNMLANEYEVDIKNRANTIDVDMPSGNTWILIAEDLLYGKDKDRNLIKYKPISLSASKATEKDLLIEANKAYMIGSIIEVFLGYDDLVLYLDSSVANERGLKNVITKQQFTDLLKESRDRNWNLFCTRPGSGTLKAYEELSNTNFKDLDLDTIVYHNRVNLKEVCRIENKKVDAPVMLMGSECYAPIDIDKYNLVPLKIYEDVQLNTVARKPTYLYFAAEVVSSDELMIDESVEEFLRELAPNSIKQGVALDSLLNRKIKDGKVKRGTASDEILININELEDF